MSMEFDRDFDLVIYLDDIDSWSWQILILLTRIYILTGGSAVALSRAILNQEYVEIDSC